jgi:hypothetical protein
MRSNDTIARPLAIFWLLLFIVCVSMCTSDTRAQEVRPETATIRLDPSMRTEEIGLWLARICVHEANWSAVESDARDCGAIMQVIERRRRRGDSWIEALMHTSPRFFHGTSDRSWARLLQPGQHRDDPQGWPSDWPAFSNYRERWQGVLENATAYATGELLPPCERAPRNWLSRTHPRDREVAHLHVEVRHDWAVVECGNTVHLFFEPVDPVTGEPRE